MVILMPLRNGNDIGFADTHPMLIIIITSSSVQRYIEQCEPSKGIGGKKKPCIDSSSGSCVRACVTDAHATVYVCVHMPKEVYEKEKMCVHAAGEAGSSAV